MEEYLTVLAAADYLGVSRDKVSRMIKAGTLTAEVDPLDSRQKLIPKKQLDALLAPKKIIKSVERRTSRP